MKGLFYFFAGAAGVACAAGAWPVGAATGACPAGAGPPGAGNGRPGLAGTWPVVPCTGAVFFVPCRSSAAPDTPAPFVARIDNDMDVSMNTTVEIVVAFESSVAEPRGPNAV